MLGSTTKLWFDFLEGVGVGHFFAQQAFLTRIEIAAGGAVVPHFALGIDQNLATIATELHNYVEAPKLRKRKGEMQIEWLPSSPEMEAGNWWNWRRISTAMPPQPKQTNKVP
jgi:hypothetical protein